MCCVIGCFVSETLNPTTTTEPDTFESIEREPRKNTTHTYIHRHTHTHIHTYIHVHTYTHTHAYFAQIFFGDLLRFFVSHCRVLFNLASTTEICRQNQESMGFVMCLCVCNECVCVCDVLCVCVFLCVMHYVCVLCVYICVCVCVSLLTKF